MSALERTTNTSSNLTNINADQYGVDEKIKLLKQHIEDFIFREQEIVVSIITKTVGCWNSMKADCCKFTEDGLVLNKGNFEVHISFEGAQVEFDDTLEDSFIITTKDTEITFNFL